MQIPGLGGRTVPMPAAIAIAVLGVLGCGLLAYAVFSGRGSTPAARAVTQTITRAPRTAVPTVIYTETPRPTATHTLTPIPSPTEEPTETDTPEASASPSPTRTRTRAPTRAVTSAPVATQPPLPTATPTQPAAASGGGARGMTGQLSLCNPKQSYAAKSDTFQGERICVRELISNTTGETITYGVLGVLAQNTSGGQNAFQSSWRGDLSVPPGGNGPTGGGWEDGLYLTEGSYVLSLSICYSTVDECVGASGAWETLTPGIPIQVVPWTP
jgi:hypothetical protein